MNIEPLEARIAPAAVVQFTDIDGDLVTISWSKGTHDQLVTATGGPTGLDDQKLQVLDIPSDPLLDGMSISITAAPQGGKGDGFVNVGRINAIGRVLGNVTVDGDLGEIDVGTLFTSPQAMQTLTVHSLGLLGMSTGAADLQSDIVGSVKAIVVKSDLSDAYVNIHGAPDPLATLGALTIGGSLRAPTSTGVGRVSVDGNIGPVKIGGSVVAGSVANSADIGSVNGSIGDVSIGGDVIGNAAGFSGYIHAKASMGNVTIGGDLKGGGSSSAGNSGLIVSSGGSLGNVKIGGSILGGSATEAGAVFAGGKIGNVVIGGDLKGNPGNTGNYTGTVITGSGNIGNVSVRGSVVGGGVNDSGTIYAGLGGGGSGNLGAVKIGGDLVGLNSESGTVHAAGNIVSVAIGGSLEGNGGINSGSIVAGKVLGTVTVHGDVTGGGGTSSGSILGGTALGNVTIGGSLTGSGDGTGDMRAFEVL